MSENGKIPQKANLHVRRLVIEAVTPLSPASGETGIAQDNLITRDMNGLPQLFGPALAGVLRHLYRDYHGKKKANELFGSIVHGEDEGTESRLEVSFGFIHDATDRPIEGLVERQQLASDEVLSFLKLEAPVKRDRVKLNEHGVAEDTGKFDRTSIPAGTRFTIELVLEGETADKVGDDELLDDVVALFDSPYLRIGGSSRQAGKVRIVGADENKPLVWKACFDRSDTTGANGWQAFKKWRQTPLANGAKQAGLDEYRLKKPGESVRTPLTGLLKLTPEDFWRFGAGMALLGDEKPADMAPLHEAVICYERGQGRVLSFDQGGVIKLPFVASGLKGALAHRAEFHLNRLRGSWADKGFQAGERGMNALFGSIKEEGGGMAGRLFLDDAYFTTDESKKEKKIGLQTHNSLDRFTQGVRNRVLFSEEMLFKTGEIKMNLCLLRKNACGDEIDGKVIEAFKLALEDLCSGRLALGGGGHGYFTGKLEGDLKAWLDEPRSQQEEAA